MYLSHKSLTIQYYKLFHFVHSLFMFLACTESSSFLQHNNNSISSSNFLRARIGDTQMKSRILAFVPLLPSQTKLYNNHDMMIENIDTLEMGWSCRLSCTFVPQCSSFHWKWWIVLVLGIYLGTSYIRFLLSANLISEISMLLVFTNFDGLRLRHINKVRLSLYAS